MNFESENNDFKLILCRRFDFSSKLQRMSVIIKNPLDNSFRIFVKGSPEKIKELSDPRYIPEEFDRMMRIYT